MVTNACDYSSVLFISTLFFFSVYFLCSDFLAQNNFFHQLRNFVIDMLDCPQCTGLHWQVAQATSLHNLYFKMAKGSQAQVRKSCRVERDKCLFDLK
jgi:hypothetical protein